MTELRSIPKSPPPWLFALTGMPYGVVGSFAASVMPYLTRHADIDVGDIGWYVTLLFVPPMLQFLYTPIVDFGPKRKHWLMIVTAVGAACLVAACVTPIPDHLTLFLTFAFLAQTVSGLVGSCNGALLATTIPDHQRGKAGGWYNVGNLCGGGISAAIAIYMTGNDFDPLVIGLVLAAMMIVPSFAVLVIVEPLREKQGVSAAFASTLRDVASVLFSKVGITGILLCLSPVGTAALSNYFSAIGIDYVRAELAPPSPELVTIVKCALLLDPGEATTALSDLVANDRAASLLAVLQGPLGQTMIAIGALGGGYLCDRYNRRALYLLSGALTAACGIAMALSPRTELTFIWGVLAYSLITGFCFAAFYATVLETIGKGGRAAATQYSLFVAAGNAAIAYVGLVDTRFHEEHGVEGVVASDAALNLAGVAVLGVAFWSLGMFKRKPTPAPDVELPVARVVAPDDL